jgi:hypothetical protein
LEGVSDEGGSPTGEVSSQSFGSEDFGESLDVAFVQLWINLTTTFHLHTHQHCMDRETYQIKRSDESVGDTTSYDSTKRAGKIVFRRIQLNLTKRTSSSNCEQISALHSKSNAPRDGIRDYGEKCGGFVGEMGIRLPLTFASSALSLTSCPMFSAFNLASWAKSSALNLNPGISISIATIAIAQLTPEPLIFPVTVLYRAGFRRWPSGDGGRLLCVLSLLFCVIHYRCHCELVPGGERGDMIVVLRWE